MGEIGSAEIGIPKAGSAEVGITEISAAEIGSTQVGIVELGSREVSSPKMGTAEIGSNTSMRFPPLVPRLYALFEDSNMYLVCHPFPS